MSACVGVCSICVLGAVKLACSSVELVYKKRSHVQIKSVASYILYPSCTGRMKKNNKRS